MSLSSCLALQGECLRLVVEDVFALEFELEQINRRLFGAGVWSRWRGERLALHASDWGRTLGAIERSAARFWGVWTMGAHCNGYVCHHSGRPQALWIARRSTSRPVDPGRLDNLVGCGVAAAETPEEALRRECWEEAGLQAESLDTIRQASICDVIRLTEAGGLHRQRIHIFDVALDPQWMPVNQDGEVDGFSLMSIDAVIQALGRDEFAADAAVVTWDFLGRLGGWPTPELPT
jgi:8-oxo-dGTP pyrophosphatase MutT (NUDIX family)